MQGGDGVHCLPRRRLAAPSGKAAAQRAATAGDGAGASDEAALTSMALHFDSPRADDSPESN